VADPVLDGVLDSGCHHQRRHYRNADKPRLDVSITRSLSPKAHLLERPREVRASASSSLTG